jgi:hypothetical protein
MTKEERHKIPRKFTTWLMPGKKQALEDEMNVTREEVQASVDNKDVDATKVRDDVHAVVCDERDHKTLFKIVTEVQTLDDSPARPKRSVKPRPRRSPDDYSHNDNSQDDYQPDDYGPDDYKPNDYNQDDYSHDDYKPDDYSPDDSDTNYVKSKPRTKNRRSRARARSST